MYLTNDDALPGDEERPQDGPTSGRFFELPNGLYRLTVHDLDLLRVRSVRKLTDADADFVIGFTPVDHAGFEAIRPTIEPTALRPAGDGETPADADRLYAKATVNEHQGAFRLLANDHKGAIRLAEAVDRGGAFLRIPIEGTVVLPGESRSLYVPERWFDAYRAEDARSTLAVMAPASASGPDELAMVCWVHGSSEWPARDDAPARFVVKLRGCFPIRLPGLGALHRAGRWLGLLGMRSGMRPEDEIRILLPAGTVPVSRDDGELPSMDVPDLRSRILARSTGDGVSPVLGRRPPSSSPEAADDPATLLNWPLRHLDLPARERLALWRRSPEERLRALLDRLRMLA